MSTPVTPLTLGLAEAAQPFPETALRAAYPARKAAASNQVTPPQLIEAMTQCLTITTNLDKEEGELGPIVKDDLTQRGAYGLSLVVELTAWAVQLTQPQIAHGTGNSRSQAAPICQKTRRPVTAYTERL